MLSDIPNVGKPPISLEILISRVEKAESNQTPSLDDYLPPAPAGMPEFDERSMEYEPSDSAEFREITDEEIYSEIERYLSGHPSQHFPVTSPTSSSPQTHFRAISNAPSAVSTQATPSVLSPMSDQDTSTSSEVSIISFQEFRNRFRAQLYDTQQECGFRLQEVFEQHYDMLQSEVSEYLDDVFSEIREDLNSMG